jgi:hypothetical protein
MSAGTFFRHGPTDSSTNGLKSLGFNVYTRTALDKSAIQTLADNESLGLLFLDILQKRAVLLLTKSDLEELRSSLPTRVWKKLEKYILTSRIPRRTICSHISRLPTEPHTEVVVESPPTSTEQPPIRTDIADYSECPIVARRKDFQEHRQGYVDREEFWTEALHPVLDSCEPSSRVVHLVDQYVFQDFRRNVRKKGNPDSKTADKNSGLVWLMSKLNGMSANQPSPLPLIIVTAESNNDDGIDAPEMCELLNLICDSTSTSALKITLRVVPAARVKPLPKCFRTRRLIMSSRDNFVLGKGASDFSQSTSQSDNVINLSGIWSPGLNSDEASALNEVLRDPTSIRIDVA